MFRKIALALGATAVIGTAALTPTTASAWHHHHHHGHWRGGIAVGLVAPAAVIAADCYTVKKVVYTSLGPTVRRITVCN